MTAPAKRPPGRPRTAPDILAHGLRVRITDREAEAAARAAGVAGMTVSAWVRSLIVDRLARER